MAHIQSIHQFKQKNINISLENFNIFKRNKYGTHPIHTSV